MKLTEEEREAIIHFPLVALVEAILPERPHTGACGPDAGCDGTCMDLAHVGQSLQIVRRLTE